MCHLRSRGRVANFKNEVFPNGGIGFEIFDFLTCCTWKRHMLHMLSYDRQGGRGVGGMLTFVSSASITLRKRHMLHMLSYDRQGGWGKSSRTIIAGTQQLDGTWKHFKKWRPQSMLHKKKQQVYQKRYSYAYSWTWRHNAAWLQTVASALPQALWHR